MATIPHRISGCLTLLTSLCVLLSCETGPTTPGTPTEPTAPPVSPAPPPPPPNLTGPSVWGTVIQSDGQPAPHARITFHAEGAGTSSDDRIEASRTADASGRYEVANLKDGYRAKVTAFGGPGTVGLVQACAANAVINGVTRLDIELVAPGTTGTLHRPPTLSGVVIGPTGGATRPLRGIMVGYNTLNGGIQDAYTFTDSAGRYSLCGIPLGPGELLAGDCNDQWLFDNALDIRGDTVFDIDLTLPAQRCPNFHFPIQLVRPPL